MTEITIEQVMGLAPVIPVLTIERVEDAVPLAEALVKGGLSALEITLRTDAALAAIEAIAHGVPGAVPGVGTVTAIEDFARARAAGACFAVSPGCAPDLVEAAEGMPFLPGIATASEAMAAQRAGLRFLKFFPAEAMGGRSTLNALAGPFASLIFCPTGGIGRDNATGYLALGNVRCVGGSWVAPREAVRKGEWSVIEKLAAEAATLAV
ncbi:MAG: bifunctional 4-hydroxy-2-oxoglutarate aldolase/2-dehydro-3-deoxy-phosphogluconate aldolase [Alphaproteobacteria bacterium]|nr:bifunctional 4-hydroxy-2-oxoglutarate aldolase/2-dehydro-3-deoxy-phosphogluconate aldolase [Alphaproteobacteria bacterium]MDP6872796.1 bifunctional 4-hydroxy-2-oxoglutarate aldolase/2-dehydro-3-deoxy-phosphogluconate aldolase [Alphaproteobacteria bacterium]